MRQLLTLAVFVLTLSATQLAAQTLSGRVTDTDGRPMELVHVFSVDAAGRPNGPSTLTAPDGTYRLRFSSGGPVRVVFRRIGLFAEPPAAIDIASGSTSRLDRTMRRVPMVLDVQEVRARSCEPIEEQSGSGFDVLLASAREQERLRETVREAFRITVRTTGHRYAAGQRIPTDTQVVWAPPLPPLDPKRARERLVSGNRPSVFRKGSVTFSSPSARLFLSTAFLRRFCADSIRLAGDDRVTMFAHERDAERTGASWAATLSRSTGMLEVLEFAFRFDSLLIGRARHEYAQTAIGGSTLPLEQRLSISQLDPRTGRVLWDAETRFAYIRAEPVEP